MPAPRPLVTAMVASAGALVLSCVSAFALTTAAHTDSTAREASSRSALPLVALDAPATLDAAIGSEPAPIAEPPTDERIAPRKEHRIPPSIGRVPQPAPAPAPDPAAPAPPAPTPEPAPSPSGQPSASPEPTTTPTPPAEEPDDPAAGNNGGSAVTAPTSDFLVPDSTPDPAPLD